MQRSSWWTEKLNGDVGQSLLIEPIFEISSQFQHIVVARNRFLGRVLILDDVVQLAERDCSVYHEMMAHVPLCGLAEAARSVLIVGGGDGCLLGEVLKHTQVERVRLVEIDPAVIKAAQRWLDGICGDFHDHRVEVVIGDAREQVQKDPDCRFDAVIVDSTDSIGPGTALFTPEFYSAVGRWLTYIGGSMAFVTASHSSESLKVPRREYRGSYYNSALHSASFVLPSWWEDALAP